MNEEAGVTVLEDRHVSLLRGKTMAAVHNVLADKVRATLDGARFLDTTRNPAIRALRASASVSQEAAKVLAQYGYLPWVITEFLSRGVAKLHAWPSVMEELLKNLGEELGSRSGGVSHFEILKDCLKREAKLELDVVRAPAQGTAAMIDKVRAWISDGTPYESAGALYALEASAVPELKVVAHLINIYSNAALRLSLVSDKYDSCHERGPHPLAHRPQSPTRYPDSAWTLDRFLEAHIDDFEKYHRDELLETLGKFVTEEKGYALFQRGFNGVMEEMEKWWTAIASSAQAS